MESVRGQGIAKLLLKHYCKEFAMRQNLDIIALIHVTNTASMTLLTRGLGFRVIAKCFWTKFKRTEKKGKLFHVSKL